MAVNKYIIQLVVETGSGETKVRGVSKAFQDLEKQSKKTNDAIKKNSDALKDNSSSAGIAGAATAEFGRLISDAPFGIQAVTNNLSQLGSMFALLVEKTGGAKKALESMTDVVFKNGKITATGWLIVFQAVIAAIEFFAQRARSAAKETAELEKAIITSSLSLKLAKQALDDENTSLEEKRGIISALSEKYPEYNFELDENNRLTREGNVAIEEQIKQLETLAKAKALQSQLEDAYSEKAQLTVEFLKTNNSAFGVFKNILLGSGTALEKLNAISAAVATGGFATGTQAVQLFVNSLSDIDDRIKILGETLGTEGLINILLGEGGEEGRSAAVTDLGDKFFDDGFALSKKFIEGLIYGQEEIEDPLLGYVNLRKLEIEEEIIAESDRQKELAEIKQAELEVFKEVELAKVDIIETAFRTIADISQNNRFIQAAALLGESAAGIAKVIINTKSANAALRLQQAAIATLNPAAAALIEAKIKANNVFAAADIAANIGATATALSRLKAPMATPSTPSIGSDGGVSIPVVAPGFNVVGAAGQNQLAAAIAGQFQQPVKAYVVSSDVTTAQELDRRIVQGASI
jgi:hypothetical protein